MEPSSSSETKRTILELREKRDSLEKVMKEMSEILAEQNVGMEDPLVDTEGYPRADIDVYNVRKARRTIIMTRNDLIHINERLKELLEKLMPSYPDGERDWGVYPPVKTDECSKQLAVIKDVQKGSPVELSGLMEGDIIMQFGTVTSLNFKSIEDIAQEVNTNIDLYIKVLVMRGNNLKRVNVRPKIWTGKGLLGCKIVPYS
ncbi:26S proteasome non-ATPase regulatory subunit 9 [Cimex lectularius]|uniref:Nas2 N-terminal domain-containing protein n=1 Tax=Cimex lectularius TaxID=79782 RepID=A0A8I6RL28_CIMLE|nr:26S proteasome non-ATPase regulatory subunit 9 [Cimex lectularius]